MKRYLAFCGTKFYPVGGWHDFLSDHDTLELAIAALLDHATGGNTVDWYHVFDTKANSIIFDSNKEK